MDRHTLRDMSLLRKMWHSPRPAATLATAAAGASLAASLAVSLTAPPALAAGRPDPPSPGAPGAGDPIFPELGNGGYDVRHYTLDFDYQEDTRQVDARTTIEARATQALSRFDLDFVGPTLYGVSVNGSPARVERVREELVITPSKPIKKGKRFTVVVDYSADPRMELPDRPGSIGGAKDGWFAYDDGFIFGLQPHHAHTAFPSNDIPSDKADFTYRVTVPDDLYGAANGVFKRRTSAAGRTTYTYVTKSPMSTQVAQVAVGDYTQLTGTGPHGLPLRHVVPRDRVADVRPQLDRTAEHIRFLEKRVGRYPFANYGLLAGKTSLGYSLENQTMTTIAVNTLSRPADSLMVHELTHQWFGDSVAPADWTHLWLSEGHATWYADLWDEAHGDDLEATMRSRYEASDDRRAMVGPPAKPTTPQNLFGDQRYGGAALVLYALRQAVGDATFQRIERTWVARHRDSSVTTRQFIDLVADLSGNPAVDVPGKPKLDRFLTDMLYSAKIPPMPGHPDWKSWPPK